METPKIILFDLDGTLIDNTEVIVDIYSGALEKLGLPPRPREFVASLGGKSTYETAKELGVPEELRAEVDRMFWEGFRRHCDEDNSEPELVEGVRDLLRELGEKGIKLAVVTSNESRSADKLLRRAGIREYFSTIVGREDVDELKPSPAPLTSALERLGIREWREQEVWYIGDTHTDVEAAIAAKVTPFRIGEITHRELMTTLRRIS